MIVFFVMICFLCCVSLKIWMLLRILWRVLVRNVDVMKSQNRLLWLILRIWFIVQLSLSGMSSNKSSLKNIMGHILLIVRVLDFLVTVKLKNALLK